jgi:hypothetical protein
MKFLCSFLVLIFQKSWGYYDMIVNIVLFSIVLVVNLLQTFFFNPKIVYPANLT